MKIDCAHEQRRRRAGTKTDKQQFKLLKEFRKSCVIVLPESNNANKMRDLADLEKPFAAIIESQLCLNNPNLLFYVI